MAINPLDHERLERLVKEWGYLSGLPVPPFDRVWTPEERQHIYDIFIAGERRMRRRLEKEQDPKKRQELESQLDPNWLERAHRTVLEQNQTPVTEILPPKEIED